MCSCGRSRGDPSEGLPGGDSAKFAFPVLVSTSPALAPRTLVPRFFSFQTLFPYSHHLVLSPFFSFISRLITRFPLVLLFSLGYISPCSASDAQVTVVSSGRIRTTSSLTFPPLNAGLATLLKDCGSCTSPLSCLACFSLHKEAKGEAVPADPICTLSYLHIELKPKCYTRSPLRLFRSSRLCLYCSSRLCLDSLDFSRTDTDRQVAVEIMRTDLE